MVRTALTTAERARGERLGALLRRARGERSIVAVAAGAGVSAETLRKIETGRIPTPAFFTVVALATTLGVSLDVLVDACAVAAAEAESASRRDARVPGARVGAA
ncbi:helix-turn-helix domain-containing protein [Frankia sp. AgPm24]|uniref:helix-turn-helix domain-containing protein n=1 Tax=Frankia sp. AgPm24 TaxID=631128 RepID=UPI00200D8AFE|nr:helix-turn-helix domain-containing protein [Frankia sp. AgPm24]MCK9921577.1 helix-turn-helix domain-containing protein [Frankia sp. AgPm24]